MRLVLPGKPQAKSQALCTALWGGRRVIVYISGNALIILGGPSEIIQTIHHDRAGNLDAVAIDEDTGKLAICWATTVYVYRPYEQTEDLLRWSLQCSFDVESPSRLLQTLSWGSSEELLVGSDALRLYETIDKDHLIWNRQLSSPAAIALFSHDASLIVSVAQHDRLAKIWRRRSYGSDDVRFDYSYLAHPTTVTGVQWRRPDGDSHHEKHVLYTVCADFKIRIWAALDPHALQLLQPWAEIDMQASIQPRIETTKSAADRYIFLIDRRDFSKAVSNTILRSGTSSTKRHFIEHLLEVDVSKPDVCVVLDSRGHMSAWAVDYIGPKSKSQTDVHNIAHLEDFNALTTQAEIEKCHGIQMLTFATNESSSQLCLLVHRHDSIYWYEGEVTDFFDPAPNPERLHGKSHWAGHSQVITNLVPSSSGESFLSWSSDSEGIIWSKHGKSLLMQSHLISKERLVDSCLLDGLGCLVVLHEQGISLWDIRHDYGRMIKRYPLEKTSWDRSLFHIERPGLDVHQNAHFLAVVTPPATLGIWRVAQNDYSEDGTKGEKLGIITLHTDSSTEVDLLGYLLESDDFSRSIRAVAIEAMLKPSMQQDEIMICLTNGHVHTLKLTLEDRRSRDGYYSHWRSNLSFPTNVENPCIVATSRTKKIAMVDKIGHGLTIWDLITRKQEYHTIFNANIITGLKWLATPTGLSILAVGFAHSIMILGETRLVQSEGGRLPWVEIREIHMQDQMSQVIQDFIWLSAGDLVVASGNQLVTIDYSASQSQALSNQLLTLLPAGACLDLFGTLEILNCSLPVYHPQYLLQMTLSGQAELVRTVLTKLRDGLKFFSDGDEISSFLDMPAENFYSNSKVEVNGFKNEAHINDPSYDEEGCLGNDEAFEIIEKLKSIHLSDMAESEQKQLQSLVQSMPLDRKSQQSLDQNGTRFLTLFNYSTVVSSRASINGQFISWQEVSWAYHSQSQEILLDRVSRHYNGKVLWQSAREAGIFLWITDHTALRTQFEVIARNEYVKTDERNPIDCSLFYLALKKKAILQGLWRMASWNREQASTQKLLANNFADPRWKTAALKNAYALLGKRRFGYAAAFFLLADNLRDAVNVCANQMDDLQLAIAVSRVFEGNDHGDVLKDLLRNRVLPRATATGNRWMASWAFWMLGSGQGKSTASDKRRAAEALMNDPEVGTPLTGSQSPDLKSMYNVEPSQTMLYQHLRDQLPPSEVRILQRKEWDFALQMAKLYWRMGCGLLALNLLRNWKFVEPSSKEQSTSGSDDNDEESGTDEDGASGEVKTEVKAKQLPKSAFEEPSTSSLLDSFGY